MFLDKLRFQISPVVCLVVSELTLFLDLVLKLIYTDSFDIIGYID
jgi:hypothetical protein